MLGTNVRIQHIILDKIRRDSTHVIFDIQDSAQGYRNN